MMDTASFLNFSRAYVRDLAERVMATFVTTLGAIFVAAEPADMLDVSFWQAASVAALFAAGSLIKGILAKGVGDADSASLMRRVD